MDEAGARAVTLLQAFETAEPPSPSWRDADRAWATRAARAEPSAAVAAASVSRPAVAIEHRARLALPRLAAAEPAAVRAATPSRLRFGWLGASLAVAFAGGLAADAIGSGQRINLLAPPFWGVLAWNLVVYLVLAATVLRRPARLAPRLGALRRGLQAAVETLAVDRDAAVAAAGGARGGPGRARDAGVASPASAAAAASRAAWRRFDQLWLERSARLWSLRTGACLHAAAAAFAGGLVAGLYLRGLALDYRAGWESTFLDADAVRTLLGAAFAPARALTGIALPEAAGFAAMRLPAPGVPAAPWIHLLGATLLAFVILPRLVLACADAALAGWRAAHFALPTAGDAYFERLARELAGAVARIVIVPFATDPDPARLAGLEAPLTERLGARPHLAVATRVAYGGEAPRSGSIDPATTHLIAWFDLAATPEDEVHGRFLAALAEAAPAGAATLVLVDTAAFARRFAHAPARAAQRRAAWTAFAATHGGVCMFLDPEPADGAFAAWRAVSRGPVGRGGR